MYYVFITAFILLDQISKYMIRDLMDLYDSIPIIDGIFHLTYIQNSGAAFSILQDRLWILVVFPAILTMVFLFMLVKLRRQASKCLLWGLTLIISGGVGNMIDRITMGSVTDFFDFRIWPVFNVADIFVCIGCGLLLIYVIFIEGKRG